MLLSPTDGFHHGTQIACKSRKHQPRQMHRKWVIDGLRVIREPAYDQARGFGTEPESLAIHSLSVTSVNDFASAKQFPP